MKRLMENWRQYVEEESPKEALLENVEEGSIFNSSVFDVGDPFKPHAAQEPTGTSGVEQKRQRKVEDWLKDVDANIKGTKFEAVFNAMRKNDAQATKYFFKKYGQFANKMDSAHTAGDAIRSVDLDTVMKTAQLQSVADLGMKQTFLTRKTKVAAVALVNDLSTKGVHEKGLLSFNISDEEEEEESSELEDTIKEVG